MPRLEAAEERVSQLRRKRVSAGITDDDAAVGVDALWSLVLLPGVLFVIDRAIIPREERHLAERFGDEYERYRLRVPRCGIRKSALATGERAAMEILSR